jgi:hypothetical protein
MVCIQKHPYGLQPFPPDFWFRDHVTGPICLLDQIRLTLPSIFPGRTITPLPDSGKLRANQSSVNPPTMAAAAIILVNDRCSKALTDALTDAAVRHIRERPSCHSAAGRHERSPARTTAYHAIFHARLPFMSFSRNSSALNLSPSPAAARWARSNSTRRLIAAILSVSSGGGDS